MNVVVIGAQWGDEGKGKIVDYLSQDADIIVRFSGGANAGHTIVTGDMTYKLHLVPSGILYPGRTVVLGIGMVIDPEAFFSELATLTEQGVSWEDRVLVADRAHLVLPRYRELDKEQEKARAYPIGTTGRGIGVAYALKSSRHGLRLADLYDPELYRTVAEEDRKFLEPYRERLHGMRVNLTEFMRQNAGRSILFEGAQGALLDPDLGTYPFVSSGVSAAAGAALGGGIGPRRIDRVLGTFKAYSTRVGNGPFPTEFKRESEGDLEERVREIGREYGVTTGRPRRCGYLDLVALAYACRANSIDSLVMTHLDVYDDLEEIKVCTAYRIDGIETREFPAAIDRLSRAVAVTRTLRGWKKPLGSLRRYEDLPAEARAYIEFIEAYTETPVSMVSVGYQREQTIVRNDPWTRS